MKRLQRILLAVIVMLAALLGGGLLLPRAWQVEREVLIAVPPGMVYPHLVSLKRWREWTVWHEPEADVRTEYSGPEAGTGATVRWNTGERRGVIKIMDVQRDRRVDYELLYDGGRFTSTGVIRLVPEGQGTRLVWRAGGHGGVNPIERYVALFIRLRAGSDLDASLARLKSRLENGT